MAKIAKMERSVAQAMLGTVTEDKRFWCHNGQVYQNLEDLQVALAEMDEDAYRYHVNESKSDFSVWVRDVIGDHKLAHDLEKSATPALAARRVTERVAFLQKRATE